MTQPTFAYEKLLLENTPQNQVEALTWELQKNLEAKRFDRSSQIGEILVAMRPGSTAHWYLLGISLSYQKHYSKALAAAERALRLDAEHLPSQLLLGELLCKAGKIMEGIRCIRSVFDASRDPSLPPAQQDPLTIRAGALLEGMKKVAQSVDKPN